eukprot:1258128-Prymnesium_polylepis.1
MSSTFTNISGHIGCHVCSSVACADACTFGSGNLACGTYHVISPMVNITTASTLAEAQAACAANFDDGRVCYGIGWLTPRDSHPDGAWQFYDINMYYQQQPVEAAGTNCPGTGAGAGLQVNGGWTVYARDGMFLPPSVPPSPFTISLHFRPR